MAVTNWLRCWGGRVTLYRRYQQDFWNCWHNCSVLGVFGQKGTKCWRNWRRRQDSAVLQATANRGPDFWSCKLFPNPYFVVLLTLLRETRCLSKLTLRPWRNWTFEYKVVQIWPGLIVYSLHTKSPGHIWTTL